MRNASRVTATMLGIVAGLVGMQHGYFEIKQGNISPGGLLMQAMGAPCQAEEVWHACLPAMTIVPNLQLTGILAILTGLSLILWAVFFVDRKNGAVGLILLSILLMLVGGGFVPMFAGVLAGIAATRIHAPPNWRWAGAGAAFCRLGSLWAWALGLYVVWIPVSWLLGHFFGAAMLEISFLLFLFFDIAIPVTIVITGFVHDIQNQETAAALA